jgi:hypothetical protein
MTRKVHSPMVRLPCCLNRGNSCTSHFRRWVTATGGFFISDGYDERSIHVEGFNRGSPGRRQPSHEDAIPLEMLRPRITSWMIQRHLLSALGINRRPACCLAQ